MWLVATSERCTRQEEMRRMAALNPFLFRSHSGRFGLSSLTGPGGSTNWTWEASPAQPALLPVNLPCAAQPGGGGSRPVAPRRLPHLLRSVQEERRLQRRGSAAGVPRRPQLGALLPQQTGQPCLPRAGSLFPHRERWEM